ncbi:MAG: hypothetical protein P8H49_03695 [Flavobacteriaceae bacterium]|nr:hypothetical protein [Flavobacteriaceae bacterium]
MIRASNSFKYQNFLLAFLWLSGMLKDYLYIYVVEFDIVKWIVTIVSLDIVFHSLIRKIKYSRSSVFIFLIFLIFCSLMVFSLTYSPSISYKYEKVFAFMVNIPFLIYPIFIAKMNFNTIIKVYSVVLIPLSLFYIYMSSIQWQVVNNLTEVFTEAGFDYLTLGIHLGILFILLNYFKKNVWIQLIIYFLLIATAARGPIIFITLLFLMMNFKQLISFRKGYIKKIIWTLVMSILLFQLFFNLISPFFVKSILRLSALNLFDSSVVSRLELIKFGSYQPFESFITFVFGNGIGSFGILYNQIDARAYPHNIILEIFFEMGIIGLGLFLLLLIYIFIKFLSQNNNVFFPLIFFILLNLLKSSSLTDTWILFSFAGGISIYSFKKEVLLNNNLKNKN